MRLLLLDLDDTLYDKTGQLGDEPFTEAQFNAIHPFPEVPQLLALPRCKKILVSAARSGPALQHRKLAILGLLGLFDSIHICASDGDKLDIFRHLLTFHQVSDPKEVFVVGNRRDSEIRWGNLLGCTTILLQHGKYRALQPLDDLEVPSFTITTLKELLALLQGLQ